MVTQKALKGTAAVVTGDGDGIGDGDGNGDGNGDGYAPPVASFTTVEKATWHRQERFLVQYRRTRTKTEAARYAGINPSTERLWVIRDALGYVARLADADKAFCDGLETFALDIVRQLGPRNSPLLLITLLNRHLPDLYRPNATIPDDTARDILARIQGMGRRKSPSQRQD
jgi:hypothetical protein